MATMSIIKLLALTFFLGLVTKGYGECSLSDIEIAQTRTGAWAHGAPEWNVTVTNSCSCTQLQVKLKCTGFQTQEAVDPSILSVSGGECLLNNGQPIYQFRSVNFQYAWDPQFPFQPLSSQIACS